MSSVRSINEGKILQFTKIAVIPYSQFSMAISKRLCVLRTDRDLNRIDEKTLESSHISHHTKIKSNILEMAEVY